MKARRLIVILLFRALVLCSPTEGAEIVPLKVIINTVDKGEHLLEMTPDGDMLLTKEQLTQFGFERIPEKAVITEGGHISLRSLSPAVSFSLSQQESALIITADSRFFGTNVISMRPTRPPAATSTKENSGFLNYAVNYSAGDEYECGSLSIPAELGLFIKDSFFFSNFSFTKTGTDGRLARMMTNITKDDTVNLIRYTAGDFYASSGALGGSCLLGGVSITKNFMLNPYFARCPGLSLSGLAQTPVEVELYINSVLTKKERLPAGAFEFLNFYGQTGAGDATLVIRDAFGREQTIETSFYLSSNLLKAGLHDYSYNLGFKRLNYGVESLHYTQPGFLGYHRYAFSNSFTGGLRGEVGQNMVNFGPLATFLVGGAGEVDTGLAVSKTRDGPYGFSAFLRHAYYSRGMRADAAFRYASRDYTNFTLEGSSHRPRLEGRVGLGFSMRSLGSISADVQFTSTYGGPDVKRVNLLYSRRLGNKVNVFVSASRTDGAAVAYQVFASLVLNLGTNQFGTLQFRSDDGRRTLSAGLEKNMPRGQGWSYELQANDNEKWQAEGWALLQYNGPYGIYSGTVRKTPGTDGYKVSLSGGIGYIDHSFFASRPITDCFALVKVGDIAGAKVYHSNEAVAVTNGQGRALVPGLISYLNNKLSYEAADIPINYELKGLEKYVTPAYRSGSVVRFEVTKTQAFEGRLFLLTKGEKTAAESALLELNVEGRIIEAVVGRRGEFYLENLKPGRYPAKVTFQDKHCSFELIVPESKDMIVTLGDIICKMD